MRTLFANHSYCSTILKHNELPLYKTNEFVFYRCVKFEELFYGKTISELHNGNLRKSKGRHSKLFPGEKISYWADSPLTARAEVKHHGSGNNLLMFWTYDDATSTFPTITDREPLTIINGMELGFWEVLSKIEKAEKLSEDDISLIKRITLEKPDCLAYESRVIRGSVNFLFFEKGFRKLSIREVQLRLGDRTSKNTNRIVCAGTSDYSPCIEAYGKCFLPIAKIEENLEYKQSDEYRCRKHECEKSLKKFCDIHRGLDDEQN